MTQQPKFPPFYDDLDAASVRAWDMISRGVHDRHARFHTPSIATTGLDGCPQIRTVVLRACDSARHTVRFHTDRRSTKFAELTADPRISAHFYDHGHKIQVRLKGRARLLSDDVVARTAWEQARPPSRMIYSQQPGPGRAMQDGTNARLESDGTDLKVGFENFVIVEVWAEELDWLYLAHQGHRRARFTWSADGIRAATWLAP